MLEDGVECEPFTIISIDSLHAWESKYYLQVDLYNCTYKFLDRQMIDCLNGNFIFFEVGED